MKRRRFLIKNKKGDINIFVDAILGTLFVFFFIFLIFNIAAFKIFDVFDPIGEALGDFQMTDYVFSDLREQPPADTNVVLVNFGDLPRPGIAEIIRIIDKYEPAVIGVDSFFPDLKPENPEGDSLLSAVLSSTKNLVMVSKVAGFDETTEKYTEYLYSLDTFLINAETAIANLVTEAENQEQMKVVRKFPSKQMVNGHEEIAFGAKLASYIDPEATEAFLARNKEYEVINFRGNIVDPYNVGAPQYSGRFFALDVGDVLTENFEPDLIKGKIVIVGYLGSNLWDTSWDDRFYTPINQKPAGRANPDMYGAVVHANIAAMILNRDFIDEMNETSGALVALLLCYLNVLFFLRIYRKLPRWYDGLTKLIQLVESLVLVFVMVLFFHWFNFKLNLTLAIVAILLAGDLIEVYNGVVKNLFSREQRKLLFKARE